MLWRSISFILLAITPVLLMAPGVLWRVVGFQRVMVTF